jgi:Asp-tRNA(Asn)/Glu-tRNA(Gln) amidotransferase C subunit
MDLKDTECERMIFVYEFQKIIQMWDVVNTVMHLRV